ncbi:hypothetical protein BGX38DRAFT_137294 [Terfezia claveryi]|nr:hypothetical protein BGX38DRAFT_137294 [Terfezia claveryi]
MVDIGGSRRWGVLVGNSFPRLLCLRLSCLGGSEFGRAGQGNYGFSFIALRVFTFYIFLFSFCECYSHNISIIFLSFFLVGSSQISQEGSCSNINGNIWFFISSFDIITREYRYSWGIYFFSFDILMFVLILSNIFFRYWHISL